MSATAFTNKCSPQPPATVQLLLLLAVKLFNAHFISTLSYTVV